MVIILPQALRSAQGFFFAENSLTGILFGMTSSDFKDKLIIFTDGSSRGNPGPGGWGAVLVFPKLSEVIELGGNKQSTTNNEMEMTAIVSALSYSADNTAPIVILTDSKYVIKGITKWVFGWERNGWQTSAKEPVKNKQVWEAMLALVRAREKNGGTIEWKHVAGHVGIPGNERVDTIATEFATGKIPDLYRGNMASYPIQTILSIDEKMIDAESGVGREKKTGPAHSYLSLVDGDVVRHKTWSETEERVKGKKAKFRKALSAEHETEILKDWGVSLDS